ncbi:sugar phosphate isomerase/epimerase family protein [Catenulispora pinisilvae]|uniref:sugar phosphate isomerase/epimerase family protein n=1 Tax=Catenulispora pinisilvae TaxID=2705253 RepID=UPI0018921FD0|nr:sugar phosphate isomerase/epimerase family protein [Catenulispora pinisilvae]
MSWPLAFSTLGCSGMPLADVAELARSTGWLGLELRAADDEPVHVGLSARERAAAREVLDSGGVTVLAVASYVRVASGAVSDDECVAATVAHAELARDLGAPYVRVFPGAEEPGAEADARAVRRLNAAAARLPEGVAILLETHDSHPQGVDIARVLSQVSGDVGTIWDVMHPWRTGEPIAVTKEALAPYLRHVQVKDVLSPQERKPLPLGEGTIPLGEFYAALRELGYQGWMSLEWESKWHPDAVPLAEALKVKPVFD